MYFAINNIYLYQLETYRSTMKEKFAIGPTSKQSFQSSLLENNFSGAYALVRERLDQLNAEGEKLQRSQRTNSSNGESKYLMT